MEEIKGLLVDWLKILNLKLEEVIAVIGWLKTKNQMLEMLIWIKENYERRPGKVEIIQKAHQISQEVMD